MFPRVAYVTSSDADPDRGPVLEALAEARLEPVTVAWDAAVDWASFEVVLVSGARDCFGRRQEFLRWARRVEEQTLLANPARTLARNTDRSYLRDLARAGMPTVETIWFEPGDDESELAERLTHVGWDRFLVMPGVVGASPSAHSDPPDAAAHAAGFAARGWSAMIRRDDPGVPTTSVVILGDRVSHAVVGEKPVGLPTDAADAIAEIAGVASDGEALLYARVDLVEMSMGWRVVEFAATAPRLFLEMDPGAAGRLAAAVRDLISPRQQA